MPEQYLQEKEEILAILKSLSASPQISQRELSSLLGVSLGKTNYLLKELIKKGLIKAKRFGESKDKIRRIRYILTPKGVKEKVRLIYFFLKRKEAEYNYFKTLWEEVKEKS